MREKGWAERVPKAHSKNSDFGTPLILVLFIGLPNVLCSICIDKVAALRSGSTLSITMQCCRWCSLASDVVTAFKDGKAMIPFWPNPKGPKIEKIQSRLKFSISLGNFNPDWDVQSWPSEFPTKKIRGLVGGSLEIFQSRLKISIPEGDLEFFQSLGPEGHFYRLSKKYWGFFGM